VFILLDHSFLTAILYSGVVGYIAKLVAGRCNFPTESCKFLTEKIMGAQNIKCVSKSPQMGNFQPQIFVFLDENFVTNKIFCWAKIGGGGNCIPASCHDATDSLHH